MNRARAALTAVVALSAAGLTAGCGGSPGAVIRTAPAESETSVDEEAGSVIGASLDPAAGVVGVNDDELSEAPGVGGPLGQASSEAIAAAEALLESVIQAMADNNFDRAATLTTAEADAFLFHLVESSRCGFSLAGAELNSVTPAAELAGIDRLAIPASATFTLDNGLVRNLTAIEMERDSQGAWLISDLLIDGFTAEQLSIDFDASLNNGLRVTQTDQCVGPTEVRARYEAFNEGVDPIVVKELYFLDNNGNRYPVEADNPVAAEPIPGRTAGPMVWEWSATVKNGYDGGRFVLVAADLEESRQEGTERLRVREYAVAISPFFSDFDVDAAAIAQALGGGVTPTTTAASRAPADPRRPAPPTLPSTAPVTTATTTTSASSVSDSSASTNSTSTETTGSTISSGSP